MHFLCSGLQPSEESLQEGINCHDECIRTCPCSAAVRETLSRNAYGLYALSMWQCCVAATTFCLLGCRCSHQLGRQLCGCCKTAEVSREAQHRGASRVWCLQATWPPCSASVLYGLLPVQHCCHCRQIRATRAWTEKGLQPCHRTPKVSHLVSGFYMSCCMYACMGVAH